MGFQPEKKKKKRKKEKKKDSNLLQNFWKLAKMRNNGQLA